MMGFFHVSQYTYRLIILSPTETFWGLFSSASLSTSGEAEEKWIAEKQNSQ